jgi:hypothetical protein
MQPQPRNQPCAPPICSIRTPGYRPRKGPTSCRSQTFGTSQPITGKDFRLESYLRDYRALRLRGVKDPAMVFSNPVRDLSSQHA